MNTDRIRKQRIAADLEPVVTAAGELARKLGLEPYPVNYWVVDHDEMNELIAYEGFQTRYPHWRWGMQYDRQRKTDQFYGGKAFEIVNNDSPANAFLQESNGLADQKAVITHVEAHSDFFANNRWFGLFGGDGPRAAAGEAATGGGREAAGDDGDDAGARDRGDTGTDDDAAAGGGSTTPPRRGPDAAAMLERHATTIDDIMSDPEVEREAVERFLDAVLCLTDTIDQHRPFERDPAVPDELPEEGELPDLSELDLSAEVLEQVFDEEWLEAQREGGDGHEPVTDVLGYLRAGGMQYDEEEGRARPFEDWQLAVLEALRAEAHYFAPQRMTKVMNEGWAAYWESLMMGDEGFAEADEFVDYADHQARVLNAPGMNPYKLGKQLWEYVENRTNRRMVLERLLRVEGVTWQNFHDVVEPETVAGLLEPHPLLSAVPHTDPERLLELPAEQVDREAVEAAVAGDVDLERHPWRALTFAGLAERHFSLARPQNRGFLWRTSREELERVGRYLFETDRFGSVEAALADLDHAAGWRRMFEIRESHNDVTFVDEFLTGEFVDENGYFAYEFSRATEDFRATGTDPEAVKRKLLLQFTNFGKPTVVVLEGNYENRNELLLGHRYNGVALDLPRAKRVLERVFQLWGRPVNLKTIVKRVDDHDLKVAKRRNEEPVPTEQGLLVRYDGQEFTEEELPPEAVEDIAADDVDYDTKPDDWLA